ncbi:MAG: uL15 family ribosomal protein [Candidatus Helarchaeota archaeon]
MAQIRDEKKIKKRRGSRTCGYGTQGQHRKSGQRGGRGKTGGKKHKWTYIVKYDPDYFGKKGFKRPPDKQIKIKTINVGEINRLIEKNLIEKEEKFFTLNVVELGFGKVLGKGTLNFPVKITAKSFSKKAVEKINNAGGQINILNENKISE